MHPSSHKTVLALLTAAGTLMLSACGGSSTDTVDNSEITEMNAAGMMEGTISDASAMDVATETNVATTIADNATAEAGNASTNMAEGNTAE